MALDIDIIRNVIEKLPFIKQVYFVRQSEVYIVGKIEIEFEGLENSLDFDFKIAPQYPLKTYESESITFINNKLIAFSHVMSEGNICIHTSHSINLEEKLIIDFNSLKNWITKYYINKEKDINYEHIVTNSIDIDNEYHAYFFTNCDNQFYKGEYGEVNFTPLNKGTYKNKIIRNFLIQNFTSNLGQKKCCKWGELYNSPQNILIGVYYFIEVAPVRYGKFGFTNFQELSSLLSSEFLDMLHRLEEQSIKKSKGLVVPLFLGYKISDNEVHWQVVLLKIGDFPLAGTPEKINGAKTGNWCSILVNKEIIWGLTRNCSYEYFFGRGVFSEKLTSKKILIIGVGAIGSMVARTLTRCGCRYIDYVDYDIKEPENICRSEYNIINGITDKTQELNRILSEISPFVNSKPLNNNYFELLIKSYFTDKEYQKTFAKELNNYDLIIDCSTDNDLMYILDSLTLSTEIVNLSITNHAKEMVCAFYPNMYKFVNHQFSSILKNDTEDLYEPTGCWSPTFKGSYNDINVLVQLALRHLNRLFTNKKQKNNFVIKEVDNNLKIIEF